MIDLAAIPLSDVQDDTPVWCVYGPDCFPTALHCRINSKTGSRVIWGFSVYRRQPGFRTLGVEVEKWAQENDAKFFLTPAAAAHHIMGLISP